MSFIDEITASNEINDYTQEMSQAGRNTIQTLNIIKIIFADLFFVLVGSVIDILLFLFVKKKPKIVNL